MSKITPPGGGGKPPRGPDRLAVPLREELRDIAFRLKGLGRGRADPERMLVEKFTLAERLLEIAG